MFKKLFTAGFIGAALTLSACGAVQGLAGDVNSVAHCAENAINNGVCK